MSKKASKTPATPKTRLRALRGFDYPNAAGIKVVRKAGGRSKLTEEQSATLRESQLVRVEAGDWCEKTPKEMVPALIADGTLEQVPADSKGRPLEGGD